MIIDWLVRKWNKKRRKLVKKLLHLKYGDDGEWSFEFSALLFDKLPLAAYADASRWIANLADPAPFISEEPRLFGASARHAVGTFPAIGAREILGVTVHPEASAMISEDRVLVPPFYEGRSDALIVDGHLLMAQKDGQGLVRRPKTGSYTEGIAVFGSGSLNWYHWLIEILPAAFLAKRLPEHLQSLPLLVPETCIDQPSFRDSLNLFAHGKEIIALPIDAHSRIDRMIFIDSPVVGPMNMSTGKWPEVTDYSQNADVLRQYRTAMTEQLGIAATKPRRRIFLARANERRSFNQGELAEIAGQYGFEVIQPELMSFRDQAKLFSEADILLGASGAAFANMIFCQPMTRSLTWVLPQYKQFCSYSNLANIFDIKLRYMFVTSAVEIRNSSDAYRAAYYLDTAAFEKNLIALLDEGQ